MISTIQPAFSDGSFEFFDAGSCTYELTNGSFTPIVQLPAKFYSLLQEQLHSDKTAQRGLDKLGITDPEERIVKFYKCNYSESDEHPDINEKGKLGPREFVKCFERTDCIAQNELCRFPAGLSKREMQVARRIALGQMDAQICYELEITQNTLRNHKNNIEQKIGATGKVAIGVWAVKNNIV